MMLHHYIRDRYSQQRAQFTKPNQSAMSWKACFSQARTSSTPRTHRPSSRLPVRHPRPLRGSPDPRLRPLCHPCHHHRCHRCVRRPSPLCRLTKTPPLTSAASPLHHPPFHRLRPCPRCRLQPCRGPLRLSAPPHFGRCVRSAASSCPPSCACGRRSSSRPAARASGLPPPDRSFSAGRRCRVGMCGVGGRRNDPPSSGRFIFCRGGGQDR